MISSKVEEGLERVTVRKKWKKEGFKKEATYNQIKPNKMKFWELIIRFSKLC